ncbi:hypothetical protein MTBBW1_200015 [Desulfamplus magnetovallimortis]|uniref:Uncharacterized protein n=1 Tax=Desulfamplus magnetovallimortis TaxID=1246637 RepID=A0A1W1HBX0_9BACT|nr:hypothetical protein MTBBW1_200015 [Desulfamplus magnetovallimortis]
MTFITKEVAKAFEDVSELSKKLANFPEPL